MQGHTRQARWLGPLVSAVAIAAALVAGAAPAAATPAKRAVPDYDGRGEAPTTAGDVLLWVPRVAMSPLYLVSEYVIRRPLGALITEMERADLPALLVDFFTFGGSSAGLIPTMLFDFGLEAGALPSGGFYFFWDDALFDGHDLRLRAAFGGGDWIEADVASRVALGDHGQLSASFDYTRRKDRVFAGIGGGFGDEAIGRYGLDQTEATLGYRHQLGVRGFVEGDVRLSRYAFFAATCCGDPSLGGPIADGLYDPPDGFDSDHTYLIPELRIALDSRAVRPGDESGARGELFGSVGRALSGYDATFARVGVQLGAFIDLYNNRVLGLRLHAEAVANLGDARLPFRELARLGGAAPLRAFAEGRLRGQSAAAAVLEYRWPIWVWLDGDLFVEAGNVFGPGFEGLEADALRLSFGVGVRPASIEDHPFELLVAAGTGPLGDGGGVTTVRVVIGTTSGF
ncbi:MAG: hypothetical protein CSA66_03795 [Proteobacteria bacterium]|nr:MAG: hypothetical protein CSA66_03795 [Pseudomonadota bacterium]